MHHKHDNQKAIFRDGIEKRAPKLHQNVGYNSNNNSISCFIALFSKLFQIIHRANIRTTSVSYISHRYIPIHVDAFNAKTRILFMKHKMNIHNQEGIALLLGYNHITREITRGHHCTICCYIEGTIRQCSKASKQTGRIIKKA